MAIRCVVLDFDGTFTDAEAEGAPFVRHYQRRLGEVVGRAVEADWEEVAAELRAGAEAHGWEMKGKLVAPATADPYLMSTCIGHRLCQRYGVLPDVEERSGVLQGLYKEAYGHSGVHFKPEAREVLEELLGLGLPVVVVTNSHTETVAEKLKRLAPRGGERLRVYGNARKFLVEEPEEADGVFGGVPEQQQVEGLGRPVWLRRGRYYEALRQVWKATDTSPEATLVAGDIYELDLALPAALGAHVQLVERRNVLAYERNALAALGARGGVGPSLWAVVERVRRGS